MSSIGRNAPCPCGSGRKYKHCCAAKAVKAPMASRLTLSLIALLLLGGAIYMLTALAATAQTFDLADLTGAELFERFCAACHGSEAHGDGPVARGLATTVPDLTLISERNGGRFPADAIRETIDGRSPVLAHGTRVMPIWGYEFWVEEGADITAEREARELMRRLVLYLESIQTD